MQNDLEVINYRILEQIRIIEIGYWFIEKSRSETTLVSAQNSFYTSKDWEKGESRFSMVGQISLFIVPREESSNIEPEPYFHIACEYMVNIKGILDRYNILKDRSYDPKDPANKKTTESVLTYVQSLLRSNLYQTANSYLSTFTSTHEDSLKFLLPIFILQERQEIEKRGSEDTQE